MQSVAHYLQRSRELGLTGTLQRAWQRVMGASSMHGQALWWGFKARGEMTDAALLARMTGTWRTVDALLGHLASRPGSSFLLAHDSPEKAVSFIRHHYPEHISAVLATADAACRDEFDLLGHTARYFDGVDWHSEPITGWRWPLLHRGRLDQYLWSPKPPADLILVWELNRQQHFAALGIAYWLTGAPRYVEATIAHIQSWRETNPVQHGINWLYGLEVAIRLIAWTLAFQFFRGVRLFQEQVGSAFLKSVFQQANFLVKHPQTTWHAVPNNHLVAEATALALVGAVFPEFQAAETWRETGLRLLSEQAVAQTHADGVNKEQATGYHRFIAELLLAVVALGRRGVLPRVSILEDTLEQMLDYMLYTSTPTGTAPMWGDSDYGRALGLGQSKDFWDFRPILAAGASLFERTDFKFVAGRFDEEAFWLLGFGGLTAWDHLEACPPQHTSRAFPHAGLYIMRDAWAADTDAAFFRCGPFGLGGEGQCVHAHCDLLSVQLWVVGRLLLVDSGTYVYYGSWRDKFRLTAAHNTVMVDGREQAVPTGPFSWQQILTARCETWERQRAVGSLTMPDGVTFRRELAHPRPGTWRLTDSFEGVGHHRIDWAFHLAPGLVPVSLPQDKKMRIASDEEPEWAVVLQAPDVTFVIKDGWISYHYGERTRNKVIRACWQGNLETAATSFTWEFSLAASGL